jgi:hypothetical protein
MAAILVGLMLLPLLAVAYDLLFARQAVRSES